MVTWILETRNSDTSAWALPSWLEKVLPRLPIVAEEPTTTRNLVATRPPWAAADLAQHHP